MEEKKIKKIKCPYCNAEYTPLEIFFATDFTGQQSEIVRDENGKIIGYVENAPCECETYFQCYYCDKVFKVIANIDFQTSTSDNYNFDSDWTSVSC